MSEIRPVRLQLSRRKGFDLQALSIATNGLPAVNVARPGRWGNPFNFRSAADYSFIAVSFGCRADALGRQQASVLAFREWIGNDPKHRTKLMERQVTFGNDEHAVPVGAKIQAGEAPSHAEIIDKLRGKNVACWCGLDQPCHANVYLELANRPICEPVEASL